jgi:hypothetical protein
MKDKKKFKNQKIIAQYKPETTVGRLKRLQRETAKKYVDLKLNRAQLDAIEKCGTLASCPWFFSVKTRYVHNIKNVRSRVIKDLHYAFKKGKKHMVLNMDHYTQQDLDVLAEWGIKYSVCKYRVFLH